MTDLAEPLPGIAVAPGARPARGSLLYLGAATLFAVNGTIAKSMILVRDRARRDLPGRTGPLSA